jgi:hypothetical protein
VNLYPFIEAEQAGQGNVKRACELLKVSRSAYYTAREGTGSARAREDAELAAEIKTVHKDSRGAYGAPRVHAELRGKGRRHSRKRIARLTPMESATALSVKPCSRWLVSPENAAGGSSTARLFRNGSRPTSAWRRPHRLSVLTKPNTCPACSRPRSTRPQCTEQR